MIVVDTSLLVDFLHGVPIAHEFLAWIRDQSEEPATTAVTVAELHRGAAGGRAPGEQQRALESMLGGFAVLELDLGAARRCGRLMAALDKAGTPMPFADGLIAAMALEHGGRLATSDRTHFDRVPGLELLTPAKPS